MFFERLENELFDATVPVSFLGNSTMEATVYDDLCQLTNSNNAMAASGNHLMKDDMVTAQHWQKVQNILPTPPCSPEDLCYQAFPDLMPPPPAAAAAAPTTNAPTNFHHGLQVVPDNLPEDLVDTTFDPLPVLELTDEEMQKLTSPTIFDDGSSIWTQQACIANLQPAQAVPNMHAVPTSQTTSNTSTRCTTEPHYHGDNTTISDVNYISHGIRAVRISDSGIIQTPGYNQSFVLTINANPIQPLNPMGHIANREIMMTPNATTWCLNSNSNLINESASARVTKYETIPQSVVQVPESPSKKNRRLKRLDRCNSLQESGSPEENTEDSEDGEAIRATHNVLERKRREELKEKFQRLRDCLPDLQDNDRAPKVLILKKSCEYIKYLQQEEQRLMADKELEKQRFLILINKQQNLLRQGFITTIH